DLLPQPDDTRDPAFAAFEAAGEADDDRPQAARGLRCGRVGRERRQRLAGTLDEEQPVLVVGGGDRASSQEPDRDERDEQAAWRRETSSVHCAINAGMAVKLRVAPAAGPERIAAGRFSAS